MAPSNLQLRNTRAATPDQTAAARFQPSHLQRAVAANRSEPAVGDPQAARINSVQDVLRAYDQMGGRGAQNVISGRLSSARSALRGVKDGGLDNSTFVKRLQSLESESDRLDDSLANVGANSDHMTYLRLMGDVFKFQQNVEVFSKMVGEVGNSVNQLVNRSS